MTYTALQSQHIAELKLASWQWRARSVAPRCHAIVMGVLEGAGENFQFLDRAALRQQAIDAAKDAYKGVWLIAPLIAWLAGKLFDIAFQWLWDRVQEWLDRNRVTGSTMPHRRAALEDLKPLFEGAKQVAG